MYLRYPLASIWHKGSIVNQKQGESVTVAAILASTKDTQPLPQTFRPKADGTKRAPRIARHAPCDFLFDGYPLTSLLSVARLRSTQGTPCCSVGPNCYYDRRVFRVSHFCWASVCLKAWSPDRLASMWTI
ncbi:unnamed protein product, partial [Iphiclides podalirius]